MVDFALRALMILSVLHVIIIIMKIKWKGAEGSSDLLTLIQSSKECIWEILLKKTWKEKEKVWQT